MKAKKLNQKLLLNKQTIADLNLNEMKEAVGGEDPSHATACILCYTFIIGTSCNPCPCILDEVAN